jgi:L-rhamnose mutarotase
MQKAEEIIKNRGINEASIFVDPKNESLQEWYKRNYESYLFKNKNDLFNLIHFMDNAEKQKITKEDMFKKLEEKGWNHEQIEYAYKKYKGLRTGMWEIPIFKWRENKKVKEEIEKRKGEKQKV